MPDAFISYNWIYFLLLATVSTLIFLPILLTLWLWFFHDRHIKRLREDLIDMPNRIQESFRGRGATLNGIEPHIRAAKRPIETELKKRESARELFLERARFISLFKIK